MNEKHLTAFINITLLIFGAIQIVFLKSQKKHTRIALTEQYRNLWDTLKKDWGVLIFIGRDKGEYYQILDKRSIEKLKLKSTKDGHPTIWALESAHKVFGVIGEISTRVLQGHITVSDIYPIFGTEFLRHSRPMRQFLDTKYDPNYFTHPNEIDIKHVEIKKEIQDWLIYHDGLRRRCLILIDLLWAEAARLEDLPPDDMSSAAESKLKTGRLNKKRLFRETISLNNFTSIFLAYKLSRSLNHSEFSSLLNPTGIKRSRLVKINEEWSKRLLREN